MHIVKIDNRPYNLDTLSIEARSQLASLQFVDAELTRVQTMIAVMQTARMAYARAFAGRQAMTPKLAPLAAPVANPHSALLQLPLNAPKVLLVTYQWSTLVEMPFLVKQAGCEVHVLCPANNWAIKNSFYDHWIDSGATMDSLINTLKTLDNGKVYQHILIGDDPILWKIYRDKVAALWHLLPIENPAALPILNKIGLSQHCRDHGIASPKFVSVDRKEVASDALEVLGLPIVVKVNYSNGGEGVQVFKDEVSYFDFMNAYDYAEPLLAQQFMTGQLVGAEALFKHGELLDYVNSTPIEPSLGPSFKRHYFPNDAKVGELVRQIGKTAGLHGFANIKMVRDAATQVCYLFEADPRPNKWAPYAQWFGRDFVSAFKAFMADEDGTALEQANTSQTVESWDVEYYPGHTSKLFKKGRTSEAVASLLDFDMNYKFTIYDPVLLKAKMEALRNTLKFD